MAEQATQDPAPAAPAQQSAAPSARAASPSQAEPAAQAEPTPEAGSALPESYELRAPEGLQFDQPVLEAYSQVARELGLTQEAAQKLVDAVAPVQHQRAQQIQEQSQQEYLHKVRTEWENSSRADKEFGGDRFDASLDVARKVIGEYATQEFRDFLNQTGLGNHPELLRFAWKVGKALSEDRFLTGAGGAQSVDPNDPASISKLFYDKTPRRSSP